MKRIVMLLLIISLASAMVFSAEALSDADTEFLASRAFGPPCGHAGRGNGGSGQPR